PGGAGCGNRESGEECAPALRLAKMVTELHVTDLDRSLSFWTEVLGFDIAYERAEEKFVDLEHPEGHQIMLCQRHGRFETRPMQHPLGQGAMLQIYVEQIAPVLAKLTCAEVANLSRAP